MAVFGTKLDIKWKRIGIRRAVRDGQSGKPPLSSLILDLREERFQPSIWQQQTFVRGQG
jgi:hypothetical protein